MEIGNSAENEKFRPVGKRKWRFSRAGGYYLKGNLFG
jgi:hypothetical protein